MLSDLAYQTDNPPGKDVDPSLAKIGTLKRMVHSTGGFTDFEFESNETNLYVATFDTIRNIPLYNFSFPGGYPGSLNASTCSYFYPSSIYTGYNFNYKFSAIGIAGGSGRNASVTMRNGSSCLSSPINFSTGTNPSIGIVTSQSGSINNIVLNSEYHFNYSITYAGLLFEIYAFKHTPYRNLNVKIGGLRIKKVDKNDGNALAETISYTYKDELDQNKSSGILHNRPNYWLLYCSVSPPNLQINHHFFTKKSSMFPISGFDGLHIRYDHISAEYIDGSKTKYKYLIETQTPLNENVGCSWNQGGQAITYPGNLIKNMVNVLDGKSIKITDTNNNNIGIKQSLNLYNDVSPYSIDQAYNYYVLNGPIKVPFRYQHRTKAPLLLSEETYLDGVVVNTVYTYDPANRFTMPITKTFTNSDGKIHKEEYTYNHDYDNSTGLRDALLTKNIISSPFRTKILVDGIHLDGPETGYAWFNLTTGNYQTNSAGAHPRPYQMYRFEKTFDSSGNLLGTGGITLQATINAYDTYGNIKQVTTPNWQPETLEWYSNGLLKKKTFLNHSNEYTFHAGTRLLATSKDIDGQVTYFDYDKLSRLSKQVSRKVGAVENVKTDYSYHYKEPSGDIYNWVQTQTTYTATTNSSLVTRKVKEIMDGLGRPIQTIKVNHSPNNKDVVFAKSYDNKGRLWKEYIPVESTGNIGTFFTIPSNTKFTETLYEATPLNRVSSVIPPSWYATTYSYSANAGTDVSNLSTGSNYAANALSKVITTDPMNNRTIVFKDKKGREVMTWKTDVSYSNHTKTYTMYDNKDRVTAIVPQGATLSTTPELTYKYTYDQDDKVLTKTIPGKGVEKILYNNRDLATFTQDAKWVAGKDWLHSKYDDYGRLLNNGRYTHSTSNDPSGDLNATYNDQYKEISYFTLLSDGVKLGKIKQTKDKILGTSNTWIQKDMNYDTYGRVSTVNGSNHLYNNINAETINTTYDFADNVMTENRTHKPSVSEQQIINKRWTYDASGRVKDHFTSLNGAETKISNQNYNFRDEMSEKNLGAATASGINTYLQSLDYSYNDQGWLTKINQSTLGGTNIAFPTICTPAMPNPGVYTPAANPDPNDLFYLELNYDANTTLITGLPTNIQKSGNIAQIAWRVRGRDRQAYNYSYDFLNRMSASTYNDVSAANAATVSNRFNENLMYDLRGNILTMNRTGYYTDAGSCLYNTIDNLTYNYAANTNKLTSITDASATASKPKGFNPGSGGTGFGYDLVGNLVSDTYKGITSITYNYLNLPSTIAWGTTKSIDFVYDASGNKLSKTVKTGATVNSIQDYVMGVEYNKLGTAARKIEAIYHAEGRYFNTSTTTTPAWRTEYSIKDHLGNSRISFTDKNLNGKIDVDNTVNNEILQESHYYAFGMTYDGPWQINDAAKDNYYLYNSKELNIDHALNWSDYGARFYDACVGRWSSVDPLAEKYIGYSPNNYVLNNPLRFIDPDGMDVWGDLFRLQSKVRNNQYEEERKSANEDNEAVANNHKSGQKSSSGSISAQSGVDCNCDCPCGTRGCRPCADKFERVENAIQTMSREERNLAFELQLNAASLFIPVAYGVKLLSSIRWLRWGKVAKGLGQGTNVVYQGFNKAGIVEYVGITGRDAAVRFGEHLSSGTAKSLLQYRVVDGATGLTRTGARVWEQTLINQNGLNNLLNVRNSIAPKYWFQYGIKP